MIYGMFVSLWCHAKGAVNDINRSEQENERKNVSLYERLLNCDVGPTLIYMHLF
jgi:hypothetical protein